VVVWAEQMGAGVFAIGDTLRDDSALAINELRSLGWTVRIASGDDQTIVERVAAEVGVPDAHGRMSPESKADLVTQLAIDPDRPVVMVGDGVNDAAALAAATVGVAVHGGAEASLEAADIYLAEPGVRPLADLIHLARHTNKTIHLCLALSLTYNITTAAIAVTGNLNALVAAIIMPISSLTVVTLAIRPYRRPKPSSPPSLA
jgi:Cu2+-exporting ATPase